MELIWLEFLFEPYFAHFPHRICNTGVFNWAPCVVRSQCTFLPKEKTATTEHQSTDTIQWVLNPVGLWPSTRNLYSSPNYFQHSIFSTALLLSIVSPDNGFDLITDGDEFASRKVKPGIILSPAFTIDWLLLRRKGGWVVITGEAILQDGRLEDIC